MVYFAIYKQCLLARNPTMWEGLTFAATVGEQDESEKCAALASIEEFLDIDAEEVFMLPTVSPVIVYNPTCATQKTNAFAKLFIAYANHPPPAEEEAGPSSEQDEELYEWLSYQDALKELGGTPERNALVQAVQNLNLAIASGFCQNSFGVPFAGEDIEMQPTIAQVQLQQKESSVKQEIPVRHQKMGVTLLSGFLGAGKYELSRKKGNS